MMDFWLPLIHAPGDDTDQIFETAQTAEEAGFTGIALIDHVVIPTVRTTLHPSGEDRIAETMPFFDVFTTAAALASVTRTIRFTSYSYVLPLRDPFSVAKQVATAAILSNYRVSLGVGVGWFFEEMEVMGLDRRTRGRRLDEMLEVMADFWDDGYCEHHGDLFDVPLSAMFPVPEAPIPVWIGGMSDRALERAAHHDGWMADAHPLNEVVAVSAHTAEPASGTRSPGTVRGTRRRDVPALRRSLPELDRRRRHLGHCVAVGPGQPRVRQHECPSRGHRALRRRFHLLNGTGRSDGYGTA